MTLKDLSRRLTMYDEQESRSVVRLMLEDCFGWTYTDICSGLLDFLSIEDSVHLESNMKRLEAGEPVQYVTGKAEFYGREFNVEPGVLIPRPETEVLIDKVSEGFREFQKVSECFRGFQRVSEGCRILDIGTGSGCIAITLAKEIENANVTAWDISEEALKIARRNAEILDANVLFEKIDALNAPTEHDIYDVIVSNPPYICEKEKMCMESNVLDHEPHIALFVPDEEPLLFYKKITVFASEALHEDGILAFELNPIYSSDVQSMVEEYRDEESGPRCFRDVTIHQDQYGKSRFLLAHKRSPVA